MGTGANGLPQVPYKDGCCRRAQDVGQNRCSGSRGCCSSCVQTAGAGEPMIVGSLVWWQNQKQDKWMDSVGHTKFVSKFFCQDLIERMSPWFGGKTKNRTNGQTVGHTKFVYKIFHQDSVERTTANDLKIFGPLPLVNDNQDSTGL
jgi:hypothetical protein